MMLDDWRYKFSPIPVADQDFVIDQATGRPDPWYAYKHELEQIVLCWCISMTYWHFSRQDMLVQIDDVFSNSSIKTFIYNFPLLQSSRGDSTLDFYDWWNRLMQHCAAYNGFIPPVHTVTPMF